jgi:transcription initiation factor TFIIIB Brf1 subunit/transcription initiation factor TFIIB
MFREPHCNFVAYFNEDTARYMIKYKRIMREQGRIRRRDIAALIYLVTRRYGIFRTIREIAETLGFDNRRELFKSMKELVIAFLSYACLRFPMNYLWTNLPVL